MKDTLEYKILKHLKENDNGEFINMIGFIQDEKFLLSKLVSLSTKSDKYISFNGPVSIWGSSGPVVTSKTLQAKIEFSGIKHLEYIEKSTIELNLAESNIKANSLNEKNSNFNKWTTIANIFVGLLNVGIILWQILKAE